MITTICFKDALLEGAKGVFETMVFMALEECGQEPTPVQEPALLGTITFKGGIEGCLGICCDQACARAIAASMLGMDAEEDLSESDISDAIGEIANMVMGAVKARIQQDVGTVEVSIPSVVQGRELRNSLGEGSQQVRLRVTIEDQYGAELSLLYREGGKH